MPIANWYAKYGLALVSYKKGNMKAVEDLKALDKDIYKRAFSNIFLRQVQRFRQNEIVKEIAVETVVQ